MSLKFTCDRNQKNSMLFSISRWIGMLSIQEMKRHVFLVTKHHGNVIFRKLCYQWYGYPHGITYQFPRPRDTKLQKSPWKATVFQGSILFCHWGSTEFCPRGSTSLALGGQTRAAFPGINYDREQKTHECKIERCGDWMKPQMAELT